MDIQRNIFLAKKYMVDSIYRSANIEGIAMTFPETQTICDGMSVSGHTIDEINAVCDLKRSWEWIFAHTDVPADLAVLKALNGTAGKFTVTNAGTIRSVYSDPIRVVLKNGEYYYPPVPPKDEKIEQDLLEILNQDDKLKAALDAFCYIAKGQFFSDGNKRTATLFANHFMIQNGLGILSIPVEKKQEFYNALTDFYAAEDLKSGLLHFLKENCITVTKEYPLHEKLVMLRKQQEYSRTYVAENLDIPEKDLFAYERGDKVPNESTIKRIEAFYGRPL